MSESCYFFVDQETPPEEQTMLVHCVKCHDERFPDQGTFWDEADGYGPFDFICDYCGEVIHKGLNEKDKNSN